MRRKLIFIALAFAMVIVGIQNSIAYFTAENSVENVFTIGNVKIELTETKWDSNMEHIIDANASFDKNPVVKNVGDNPAYVRLSVNVSHVSNLQNAINRTGFVPKDLFGGYDDTKWILANEVTESDNSVTYYYHYYKILEVGQSTETIFETIDFPSETDPTLLNLGNEAVGITIKADAIQSDGFETCQEAFVAFDAQV